jgi:hypothetical protein
MRTLARTKLVLLLAGVLALACQKPDVGAACTLAWGSGTTPPPRPQAIEGEYFQSGNIACEDLVCIVSPISDAEHEYVQRCQENGDGCGYCSKPCVSNEDCYTNDTGLVCDLVLPDAAFLAELDRTEEGRALRARYLADIAFSSYCVIPRSSG